MKLLKGPPNDSGLLRRFRLNRTATVALRLPAEPMKLGDWTDGDSYTPGSTITTYLAWSPRAEAYESVWWNAVTVHR